MLKFFVVKTLGNIQTKNYLLPNNLMATIKCVGTKSNMLYLSFFIYYIVIYSSFLILFC